MKNIVKEGKYLIMFHVFLVLITLAIYKLGLEQNVIDYIMFQTNNIHFQDFLNVLLTLFNALFGLVVTICSVLIALGNNPIIKALRGFKQSKQFMGKIKISLITSSLITVLISLIYCGFDFSNITIRFILIYLILLLTVIFIKHFKSIIQAILLILEREIE